MKHVLILGGGSAGVMLANRLRKEVPLDGLKITVIEKKETHIYQPAFTLVVFDLDLPENLVRPMKGLLYEGINLVTDEVTKINPKENTVTTGKHGDISYDYLVVATGAAYNYDEPIGMKAGLDKAEKVFTFYTLDGAIKLRDALKNFKGGTIACTVSEMPIKCPAAPMKFIMMAEDYFNSVRGIRDKVKFIFTTPMPAVFSREPYASKLSEIFKRRGIETIANFTPSDVDNEKCIVKDYGGKEFHYDLLCIIPPHEGEAYIEESEGVGDAANWAHCDKHTMLTLKHSNIYGIGDATDFPTSKTASGVRKQAAILTNRIISHLKGEAPTDTYDGEIICPMLTKFNRVMFAHFNYTESMSPAIESYANWVLKVHMLRPLYWNLMLRGLM
jgi:sulfide:quinone oxidoreductase